MCRRLKVLARPASLARSLAATLGASPKREGRSRLRLSHLCEEKPTLPRYYSRGESVCIINPHLAQTQTDHPLGCLVEAPGVYAG